jgi:hypothetical protein
VQNQGYSQANKMTRSPTSPWLLLLATAAAISTSVDAFAHRSSVMGRRNSFVHQKLLPLHFSATEIEEIPLDVVSASDIATPEDAKDMLALNLSEVGPEGVMPFAPMMTFKKFVTMQVCRYGFMLFLTMTCLLAAESIL